MTWFERFPEIPFTGALRHHPGSLMTRPTARRRLLSLALAAALAGPVTAQTTASPLEPFTVQDIRVDGLQRISAGTVFTYLPVERGDLLDRSKSSAAIRALFKTGFFSDIKLERQGDVLVVAVVERPAINTIELKGNKELKTDELMKGLKSIGLSEGETYNPLNLDRVTQELTRQYNNRGKYGVTITPTITPLDRNRVDVKIDIAEGKAAKIRDINIVGNTLYPDQQIRQGWESSTSNWLSWYRRDDQYSREKISGDLEKLSNFYLDRGYVDFNVESTQIAISPSRQDMFVTANVSEGEKYKISEVKVTGDTVLPQEQVEKMVVVKADQTFSRALVELSTDSISTVLGNIGYAFAEVTPVPEIDRTNHTVALNFVVKPGPRVTVRRIMFKGNASTADEVMRRELRQFEGGWYSQAMVDRSKIRLQRTGFFESVEVETPEVAGRRDQVDVVFTVKERNAGSFVFGVGYSQNAGIVTSISLQQNNFLGTGNRFSVGLQNNNYSKSVSFSYLDPYFTDSGVSVGYTLSYSDYNQSTTTTARYGAGNAAGEAVFGIPLSENVSVTTALGIFRNQITTYDTSTPPEVINYLVSTLGDRLRNQITLDYQLSNDDGDPNTPSNDDYGDPGLDPIVIVNGTRRQWTVNAWTARAGFAVDTRNSFVLPSTGMLNSVIAEAALPGSDLEYYRISYDFEYYRRLAPWVIGKASVSLGYGDAYGDTSKATCYSDFDASGAPLATDPGYGCGLPFFKHFYAGGPGSVRGFSQNTLGPTTNYGGYSRVQPLGGPIMATGSFEFFFPKLLGGPGSRVSAFVDYGNVWARKGEFSLGSIRVTTGLALQWESPVGPITISYAIPVRYERPVKNEFGAIITPGDEIERLQFTFGNQR
jgi:outer membrane protein insertion porin family